MVLYNVFVSRETFLAQMEFCKMQECDFLIIGSGIAGLSFALRAAKLGSVVIITKKGEVDTATNLAQGGIAAVLSPDDELKSHIRDTLESGAGLCDEKVVALVVEEGPARVRELVELGVEFARNSDDSSGFDLGMEGGHSQRRVAHAHDFTGKEIERALLAQVKGNKKIQIYENHRAIDLVMRRKKNDELSQEEGKGEYCAGAYVLGESDDVEVWLSKITVLCTGGTGKVYLYTTNPDIATGDGLAMAYRAGAIMSNLEFVQFHPTCLYHPKAKNFLISEAVRGEGAILVNNEGQRFMEKYDTRAELATRDTVARAIDNEMKRKGDTCVYLDITHRNSIFIKERFPTIYARCLEYGIDITKEKIPVVPAAHYMCGGVETDMWGCTSIDGLMALGETACTGLHGGNRLASNSLLEAVVFAERAFEYCEQNWKKIIKCKGDISDISGVGGNELLNEEILINHNWDSIRRIMWNYVGIVRTVKRLRLAKKRMEFISEEIEQHYREFRLSGNMVELRNISLVSLMIINSALARKESRGLHYLADYPDPDDAFKHNTRMKKAGTNVFEMQFC